MKPRNSLPEAVEPPKFDSRRVELVININSNNDDAGRYAPPADPGQEAEPLLREVESQQVQPRKPSWLRRAGHYLSETFVKHPIASVLGFFASGQPAINALVAPSHSDPKDLGSSWWNGMGWQTKTLSIVNAFFSFYVNFPVNTKFMAGSKEALKKATKDMFSSPKQFFGNLSTILLGVMSANSLAAITFNSFLFLVTLYAGLGYIPAGILASLSFLSTSATRYMGLKRFFQMLGNIFDHDARVQLHTVDALKHLRLDHNIQLDAVGTTIKQHLEDWIVKQHMQFPLQDHDYENLFTGLAEEIAKLQPLHPDKFNFFSEKQAREYILQYTGVIVKLSCAAVFGFSAGGVFMQKGYDGINIIAKFANKDLDAILPLWSKLLIGAPAGTTSGILYAASTYEFMNLFFVQLPLYLFRNPAQILPTLTFLAVPHYFASSSLENITENVLKRPDNILGLPDPLKAALPYLVRSGCIAVNTVPFLREFKPTAPRLDTPSLDDVIRHFEDPNTHKLDSDHAARCVLANNTMTFFRPAPKPEQLIPSPSSGNLLADHPEFQFIPGFDSLGIGPGGYA